MISKKYLKYSLIGAALTTTVLTAAVVPTVLLKQDTNQSTKQIGALYGAQVSNITVKTSYPTDLQVHDLLDVINPHGFVNVKELEVYVDLIQVPDEAILIIQNNPVYDYKLGKVTFNINMDRYYAVNDVTGLNEIVYETSNWIPITLTVSPRLTSVTPRTDYAKISVDKLHDLIFETSGIAKTTEISKYISIKGAADGAVLHLKPNSYITNTGMGTVNFTVFFDKYYAADGTEKTQTSTSITSSYAVSLQLLPMATVITSKASYTPTHRVDRFISTFTDTNGNVTNENTLKLYVDLQNLPTGYTLKISGVNINDPASGTISFNVIASTYNDLNFVQQTNGVFPIRLLKLLPKYPPTEISAKSEGAYDDTVRVDRFIKLFADDAGVVTDKAKLGEFVDLIGIPETAKVTITGINKTDATGEISFNIVVSRYYDANSDLVIANKVSPINLKLAVKHLPTQITAVQHVVSPERIDRFETEIKRLSGTAGLRTYLENQYITITGDVPENMIFSVGEIQADYPNGAFTFDLIASQYYDSEADLRADGIFKIDLLLRVKYPITDLKAKTQYLPNERVDRFVNTLAIFSNQDLVDYVSEYVDGLDTLVTGSTLSATAIAGNNTSGVVSFNLKTNKYYDADSNIILSAKEFSISLNLGVKNTPTTITAKTGNFTSTQVDTFIPLITNDQLVVDNMNELNKYVTVNALPLGAQLKVKDANVTFATGLIRFKLVADKFYDVDGDLVTTAKKEFILSLSLGIKYQATTVDVNQGYNQTENVQTFVNQIKTLTGSNLTTYLATYITINGDIPSTAIISVDSSNITYDLSTGKVTFNVLMDQYYNSNGKLQTNGSFQIKLILAY